MKFYITLAFTQRDLWRKFKLSVKDFLSYYDKGVDSIYSMQVLPCRKLYLIKVCFYLPTSTSKYGFVENEEYGKIGSKSRES